MVAKAKLRNYLWTIAFALIAALYFYGLTIPLVGPDEPRYAQVAREMFERGDWMTPTLGGHHWFEKPALVYWLQIASYHLFGVNEFAARFGSALCGLGTVVSLWFLGRSYSRDFANWLAVIAATTLGILVFARGASFDIVVTFPITAALVSFFLYARRTTPPADADSSVARVPGSDRATIPPATAGGGTDLLALFYFFIGLALLAKGLIGIVFPFAIVGLYHLFSRRRPTRAFLFSLLWGTILAATVASVWYVPMCLRHGSEFINEFFIAHHFQRFTSNKYQHPQPFYFYLWVFPLMALPWTPFLIASLVSRIRKSDSPAFRPLMAFAICWMLVPLAFFSFSGSKLPGYVLPSAAPAIILAVIFLFPRIENSKAWKNSVAAIAVLIFLLSVAVVSISLPRFAVGDSVKALVVGGDEAVDTTLRVLMLHTISHNAEFYAAGRIYRDQTGKQVRLSGNGELLAVIGSEEKVLVLVPLEYLDTLLRDPRFTCDLVQQNDELAAVIVSVKY